MTGLTIMGTQSRAKLCLAGATALSLAGLMSGCTPEAAYEAVNAASAVVVEETQEAVEEFAPFDFASTIEPTVLVDNEVLRVTAKELAFESNQAVFTLEVENRTQTGLTLSTGTIGYAANSINEYMISDGWASIDVPAGQVVEGEVAFTVEELMLHGIREVAEAGFGMRVVDDSFEEVYRGYASVPTSSSPGHTFDASAYGNALKNPVNQGLYEYSLDKFATDVLFDQGGIRLSSEALITSRDGERTLKLEFENATGGEVLLLASNIVVDGKVAYEGVWDSESIVAGKRGFIDLDFDLLSSACEDEGGLDVANLSGCDLTLSAVDANDNTVLMPAAVSVSLG